MVVYKLPLDHMFLTDCGLVSLRDFKLSPHVKEKQIIKAVM